MIKGTDCGDKDGLKYLLDCSDESAHVNSEID